MKFYDNCLNTVKLWFLVFLLSISLINSMKTDSKNKSKANVSLMNKIFLKFSSSSRNDSQLKDKIKSTNQSDTEKQGDKLKFKVPKYVSII